MLTFLSFSFWFYALYFIVALFLAAYIPGNLLTRRLSLSTFQNYVISLVIGLVLWAWQGFLFGYLQLRWLSYVYIVVAFLLWIYHKGYKQIHKPHLFSKKTDLLLCTIISIGVVLQVFGVFFMGTLSTGGMHLCCGNVTDNIAELAIVNEIVKHFPPFEPGLHGIIIQNYHYWNHLIIAEFIRVFYLPLAATTFQYFSVLLSILLGLSAVIFAQLLKLRGSFIRWLVFFLYLGGDGSFVLLFLMGKGIYPFVPAIEHGTNFLFNYPRAFSIDVLFVGLSLLLIWIKNKKITTGIIVSLVFSSLVGLKIYVGFFGLFGLGILGLYYLWKRSFMMLIPIALAFILSLLIYLPVNANAGGLFFSGTWRFENFIMQPALGLDHMELAREIYVQHHSYIRILQYELMFALIYLFCSFGTKLIGLIQSKQSLKLLPLELNIFLIPSLLVSLFLGLFFLQKTGGANTFNFLASVFIIGSVYTALACFYWLPKLNPWIKYGVIVLIVLITIPRAYFTSEINYVNAIQKPLLLSNDELDALLYLQKNTPSESLILTDRRIALNLNEPYVGYLSNRPLFLAGEGWEEGSRGTDFNKRIQAVSIITKSNNPTLVTRTLRANHIDYLYYLVKSPLGLKHPEEVFKTVYRNDKIRILKPR